MVRHTALIAAVLALGGITVPTAAEAGVWQQRHPARAHINKRIARQQVRITHEVRQGDISRPEARDLRRDLHDIRRQERAYARGNDNGGHLTRPQARELNRSLNRSSRAIGPWRVLM